MKLDCGIELVHMLWQEQYFRLKGWLWSWVFDFYLFELHPSLSVWASGMNLPLSLYLCNEIHSPESGKQKPSSSCKRVKASPLIKDEPHSDGSKNTIMNVSSRFKQVSESIRQCQPWQSRGAQKEHFTQYGPSWEVNFEVYLLAAFAVVLCCATKCGRATVSLIGEKKHIFVIAHTTISTVLNASDTTDPVVTYSHCLKKHWQLRCHTSFCLFTKSSDPQTII